MSKKATTQEFIEKAKGVHSDKYDYSKVNYVNNKTKVTITCRIHGDFEQRPDNHIGLMQGCMKCKADYLSLTLTNNLSSFIERANIVHKNKYNYSKTQYTKSIDKVNIICVKHGNFIQEANSHLRGHGCPKCGLNIKLPIELRGLVKRTKGTIQQAFLRKSFLKTSKTFTILNCTWEEFKIHLEDNDYGFIINQKGLDLDHIIPISSAKTEEDVYKLNHWSNFQLLPEEYNRNIKKGKPFDKLDFEKWLKIKNKR
jgi:hypothetical protein